MPCIQHFNSYKALKVSERPKIVHQAPFLTPHLEAAKDIATKRGRRHIRDIGLALPSCELSRRLIPPPLRYLSLLDKVKKDCKLNTQTVLPYALNIILSYGGWLPKISNADFKSCIYGRVNHCPLSVRLSVYPFRAYSSRTESLKLVCMRNSRISDKKSKSQRSTEENVP